MTDNLKQEHNGIPFNTVREYIAALRETCPLSSMSPEYAENRSLEKS
ncbi:hypothetical protein OZX74_08720 [Bifidobacterium sp. ESL0798]|nr:hypothetical protein [Bifidobacterium sp. ESL0798]WEV73944.1 hypothetical protein OZX74_08720 [Bifidobacterium sp. ESL0798]